MDLTVVETRSDSQEYPWIFEAAGNYKVIRFPGSGNEVPRDLLHETVRRIFEETQPAVVVTTGWADREYHAVALRAISRKAPMVIISDSRFEDEPRKWHKEFIKRLILRSYSAALVAGKASRSYLLRLGFNNKSIFQPWDVVDNDHFKPGPGAGAAFHDRDFLCISRFIPKKNLERLVDAFAQYARQGGRRRLNLLGDGELTGRLKSLVKEAGLADRVTFAGFVQYDDLPRYLHRALCLILPSTTDQWGLVVNEAMASGLPVLVSTSCGCAEDLVENEVNGYRFHPESVGEITNVLNRMENISEDMWLRMSSASMAKISAWNPQAFAGGLLNSAVYARDHSYSRTFAFIHRPLAR
jgi:glycosyltransferase involved in cell wall biosynthesis